MFKRKQKYFVGVAGKFFKLVANALPAPVATAATSITSTSFTANWDPYDGADTYYLDVSISPTFSSFVLQNQPIAAPSTSYNVTGLTICTTYYYRVRAEGLVPSPLSAPTLTPSGTQSTGTVISISSVGVWLNQGATFQYRWTRDGAPIAFGATYTIQPIDDGTVIRCEVLNTNNFGSSTWVPTSNSVNAVNFDVNAAAYISVQETAGATLSPTQKTAINNLFLDLKGQGPNNSTTDFWTTNKVKRWWPLVGASAAPNAIDVRLNTGTWNGGWTHTADGAKGNASNTWFNSGLALQGEINQDWGFGYYGAEYTTGDWMCGIIDYSLSTGVWAIRDITGAPLEYWNAGRGSSSATANTALDFIGARTAYGISNNIYLRYNGTNTSFLGLGPPSGDTAVNMVFGNAIDNFTGLYGANDMEYRSMYITFGLSIADSAILQNIDNAFQTALGRNTY